MDVGNAAAVTVQVFLDILAGGHDVAEVHNNPDAGSRQAVRQQSRALQVPAETQEVQGFGPEFDAELRRALSGTDQLGGDEVQILAFAAHRVVVQCAARQDQRLRAGVRR